MADYSDAYSIIRAVTPTIYLPTLEDAQHLYDSFKHFNTGYDGCWIYGYRDIICTIDETHFYSSNGDKIDIDNFITKSLRIRSVPFVDYTDVPKRMYTKYLLNMLDIFEIPCKMKVNTMFCEKHVHCDKSTIHEKRLVFDADV